MINSKDQRLSEEAKRMIKQQYGFRTDAESLQSINEYQNRDIIDYETNKLQNTDIPDTIMNLYGTFFTIDDQGNYPADAIDNYIREELKLKNNENYHLIWLVDQWQKCFSLYTPGHKEPKTPYDIVPEYDPNQIPFIDVYAVRPDDMLVSDLDYDGQLIATKHQLTPIHGFNH